MKQNRSIIILLILSFLIAIVTLNQYGESWDEMKLYRYAADSIEAYGTWFQHGTVPVTGGRFENYGPAFIMFTSLIVKAVTRIVPGILSVDVQHMIYFLMFLAAAWTFHQLAVRWMSRTPALGATLLFMTQPVFWGHAFINPKDIPLLALFLLTVYLGLKMHERIFERDSLFDSIAASWKEFPARTRQLLTGVLVLWLAALFVLFGGTHLIYQWIDSAVHAAASGEPSLLSLVASKIQRVAPEIYIEKFFVLFLRVRLIGFLLLTCILIALFRRHLPVAVRALGVILPAGVILGLAVSIRIFGIWAGVLVAGYILWKSGVKSWLVIAVYALIAICAMYLTWPYLWPAPIEHFLETVQVMSQHPWPGSVLFNGVYYAANDLPAYYVPLLLGIQLTEPTWVLVLVGLAVAGYSLAMKRADYRELLLLSLVWFVVPLVTFIILRPTLYDNFRQIFFILPPVFFIAGLTFEQVRKPVLQGVLIALVILPGLIAYARLHPYEYVYYNQFIGGTGAVVDRFELDYWATSYREAAEEINRIAPPDANVWVDEPDHVFSPFARPDLNLYSAFIKERADHYGFVVTLARYDKEKTSFAEAKIVYTVTRDGAVFAVIRTP